MIEDIGLVAGLGLLVLFVIALFSALRDMAVKRGRSGLNWIVTGLLIDPFGAMILLWIMGPAQTVQPISDRDA
ncbi:MAG: hypothetical protein AAF386_03220 [Pseudomonadota bacterium]